MSNDPTFPTDSPFDGVQSIPRTVSINDVTWVVAADVARGLGCRNAADVTRSLSPDMVGYALVQTSGGPQKMIVVTQHGAELIHGRRRRPIDPSVSGWIYYVTVGDLVKIGFTGDIKARMRAYPPGSDLLASHRGTLEDEKRLHASLRSEVYAGNEWYRRTEMVMAVVADAALREEPVKMDPAPPAVQAFVQMELGA